MNSLLIGLVNAGYKNRNKKDIGGIFLFVVIVAKKKENNPKCCSLLF